MELDICGLLLVESFEFINFRVHSGEGRPISLALPVRPDGADDKASLLAVLAGGAFRDLNGFLDRLMKALDVVPITVWVCAIGASNCRLRAGLEVVTVCVLDDARVLVQDECGPLFVVQVAAVLALQVGS